MFDAANMAIIDFLCGATLSWLSPDANRIEDGMVP